MSIQCTDAQHVLLYDSVSGEAYPLEVFESEEEAQGFVVWLERNHIDLRRLDADELTAFRDEYSTWLRDANSGEIDMERLDDLLLKDA